MNKRLAILAVPVAIALSANAIMAQDDYPSGPIELIIPFSAGSNDSEGRAFAHALSEYLGQPVVAQNRPGAAGTVGADYLTKAAPDGQTLLFTISGPANYAQYIFPDLTYDVPDDFQPVAGLLQTVAVLVKTPHFEPDTVDEIIDYARENPNGVRFGTPGVGSGGHILVEAMNYYADVEIQHVPYQGGAPVVADLLAGRIELAELTMSTVNAYLESGDIEIVALVEPQTVEQYPNYRIIEETLPGIARQKWYGLFAPVGTPEAVLDKLEAAAEYILSDEKYVNDVLQRGDLPYFRDREEFTDLVNSDVEAYGRLIKETEMTFQ